MLFSFVLRFSSIISKDKPWAWFIKDRIVDKVWRCQVFIAAFQRLGVTWGRRRCRETVSLRPLRTGAGAPCPHSLFLSFFLKKYPTEKRTYKARYGGLEKTTHRPSRATVPNWKYRHFSYIFHSHGCIGVKLGAMGATWFIVIETVNKVWRRRVCFPQRIIPAWVWQNKALYGHRA